MEITKDKLEGQRKLVQGLEKQRDESIAKFNEQNEVLSAMSDAYEAQQRLHNMTVTKKQNTLEDSGIFEDMKQAAFELYIEQLHEMGIPVHHFRKDELRDAFETYQSNLRGDSQ